MAVRVVTVKRHEHLGLLEQAGLVVAEWVGREKHHYLNPMPIQKISARWIHKFEQRVEESTLCIYRDKVYVLAGDGYVHALK